MELDDYLRLADDGCPHCPEHAFYFDPEPEWFAIILPQR